MNNLFLYLYLLTSFLWATYALGQYYIRFGYKFSRVAICFVLDFLLCPIGIIWAILYTYTVQMDEKEEAEEEEDEEDN